MKVVNNLPKRRGRNSEAAELYDQVFDGQIWLLTKADCKKHFGYDDLLKASGRLRGAADARNLLVTTRVRDEGVYILARKRKKK